MPAEFKATFATKYSPLGEKLCVVSHYEANKSPALMIRDAKTGEPLLTASVCVDRAPQEGNIIIKDWSENEGIEIALIKAGLIGREELGIHPTGHVTAAEFKMLGALADAWKRHQDSLKGEE